MIFSILKQFSEDLEENLINIVARLTSGSKTFSTLSFFILGKEFLTKKSWEIKGGNISDLFLSHLQKMYEITAHQLFPLSFH